MPDRDHRIGYCSACNARTVVYDYPGMPQWVLCDACYEAWQNSDWETLLDSALQERTVIQVRFEMLRRKYRIADQIAEEVRRLSHA